MKKIAFYIITRTNIININSKSDRKNSSFHNFEKDLIFLMNFDRAKNIFAVLY